MHLYANPNRPDHAKNNAAFVRVVNDYPVLSPFQPAPEAAPWHWQAVIDLGREPILLNFWPHKAKAQRDGFPAVEGYLEIHRLIEDAITDASEVEFEVFE